MNRHGAMAGSGAQNSPLTCKMLIPIDATDRSRRCLRYAEGCAHTGEPVEVVLLFVAEPVRAWEVLKFRTAEEVHLYFQERAEIFLVDAEAQLREAGIPCRSYFRETSQVTGILDAADEFSCTEIVLPKPEWHEFISGGLASKIGRNRRAVPVVVA